MIIALGKFLSVSRWLGVGLVAVMMVPGCSSDPSDKALDTDANGYLCQGCSSKFYTDREVFADVCPNCKSMQLSQVVGFVCAEDKHMTVATRGSGFTACEKCKKTASGLAIPRESDLKTWGAPKKSKQEVSRG